MTDNEIVKNTPLDEELEHYQTRLKEVFDSYYRRNTNGSEDPLEICVLRDSRSLINRLQAENERLTAECGNQSTLWSKHFEGIFETAKETIKAEAYKEFADRLKAEEKFHYDYYANISLNYITAEDIDNLLKELVGDNNV